MSTHDHDDALEHSALEQKVLDAWRDLPKAEPSDALDDRILAMARRAVATPGAAPARRPQWPVRLALAATVVLAAGVALQVTRIPRDSDRAVVPSATAPAAAPAAPVSEPAKAQDLDARRPSEPHEQPITDDGTAATREREQGVLRELQKNLGESPLPADATAPPPTLSDKKLAPAAAAEAPAAAPQVAADDAKQRTDDRPAAPAAEGKALDRRSADEAKPFPASTSATAPAAPLQSGVASPANPSSTPADAPAPAEKLKSERAAGAGADAAARGQARGQLESTTAVARPAPVVATPPPPSASPSPAAPALAAPEPLPAPPAAQASAPADAVAAKSAAAAGPATTDGEAAAGRRKELGLAGGEASQAKDNEADRAPAPAAASGQPTTTAMPVRGNRLEESRRDRHDADQRTSDRGSLGGTRAEPPPPAPKAMQAPAAPAPFSKPAPPPRPLAESIDRSTPEAWIRAIQRLYAMGERELAKTELKRLHEVFPDARVPDDLDAALR